MHDLLEIRAGVRRHSGRSPRHDAVGPQGDGTVVAGAEGLRERLRAVDERSVSRDPMSDEGYVEVLCDSTRWAAPSLSGGSGEQHEAALEHDS